MGKYIKSLETRMGSLNFLFDEAERVAGKAGAWDFTYQLCQDDLPYSSVLTITHEKQEVISIEYVYNKSLTPQISLDESQRIKAYLIEELIKQTRNGFAPLLAKKIAFGITHQLRRLESPDKGVDLMASV